MQTKLQANLAAIAPSVSIVTEWEHDPDSRFSELTGPGGAFENELPEDWQAWQSEIRASVIHRDEVVSGSAYLGGTWERYGDAPAAVNPTISGYELQMTGDALADLAVALVIDNEPDAQARALQVEIDTALAFIKAELQRVYDEQQADARDIPTTQL